jgi:hypothetical protein
MTTLASLSMHMEAGHWLLTAENYERLQAQTER